GDQGEAGRREERPGLGELYGTDAAVEEPAGQDRGYRPQGGGGDDGRVAGDECRGGLGRAAGRIARQRRGTATMV
ncbi:MAG TPA: hypothetical protein VE760_08710, partial [Acidimicrobiales bacterium]|nr:hypothetical protein [Acidimicrobiales bacterium]